jgi:hypothetical protein
MAVRRQDRERFDAVEETPRDCARFMLEGEEAVRVKRHVGSSGALGASRAAPRRPERFSKGTLERDSRAVIRLNFECATTRFPSDPDAGFPRAIESSC